MRLLVIAVVAAGAVALVGLHASNVRDQVLAIRVPPPSAAAQSASARSQSQTEVGFPSGTPLADTFEQDAELDLLYFGSEVSLNDLGELAVADPEFERALRAQANELGEIRAVE